MPVRQTVFLCLLTALYLLFEMAFNARLLDVVGVGASVREVERIEHYGRLLSGTAVALFVLQYLLKRRAASPDGRPGWRRIMFFCLLAMVLVYGGLKSLVESITASRSAEFRRAAFNLVLVQRALIDGKARLDGLDDRPEIFLTPEGKAFIALFPTFASFVPQLDERIGEARVELLRRAIGKESGGPATMLTAYNQAMDELAGQWKRYRQQGGVDVDAEIRKRQQTTWNDYLASLGKRGWTPSSVPARARAGVVRQVRSQGVRVPADWDPADEATFRAGVAAQVRHKAGDGSVTLRGQRIPPGLGWPAFVAHAAVQAELRDKLGVPAGVAVRHDYPDAERFMQQLYEPVLGHRVREEARKYDAPLSAFAPGGAHAGQGLEATRAALVPPIALFFSLLGAMTHGGKLIYLGIRLVGGVRHRETPPERQPAWLRRAWLAPVGVVVFVWLVFSALDNEVTRSQIYAYLRERAATSDRDEGLGRRVGLALLGNALHVVAVGQSYAYPLNESIRTRVLGNISYGYARSSK